MCYFVSANFLVKYLYLCLAKIRITYWKFRFLSIVGRQDQIQSRGRNTISQSIGFQSYGQLVTTWHASVHKGGAVRMTRFQQNHCAGRTMQVAKIQIQIEIQIGCQDNQISTESLRQKNNAGCKNINSGPIPFSGQSRVFICIIYLRNRIQQEYL